MDNNVLVALISASSSGLVAITALVLNYRGFSAIDAAPETNDAAMNDAYTVRNPNELRKCAERLQSVTNVTSPSIG